MAGEQQAHFIADTLLGSHETGAVDISLVFRGLSRGEAEAILEMMEDKLYPAGACVFQLGEPQKGIYLVKKGLVEEFRLTEDGNRLPMNRVGPGKLLSLSSVKGGYCCFAETIEESVIGLLSFQRLEELSRRHPKVVVNLLRALAERMGEIEQRLEVMALKNLRARVASALLQLCAIQGPSLKGITHETLSNWVASSRPKVSLVLEEAQRAGLLRLSRGAIEVVNPEGLKEWAKL